MGRRARGPLERKLLWGHSPCRALCPRRPSRFLGERPLVPVGTGSVPRAGAGQGATETPSLGVRLLGKEKGATDSITSTRTSEGPEQGAPGEGEGGCRSHQGGGGGLPAKTWGDEGGSLQSLGGGLWAGTAEEARLGGGGVEGRSPGWAQGTTRPPGPGCEFLMKCEAFWSWASCGLSETLRQGRPAGGVERLQRPRPGRGGGDPGACRRGPGRMAQPWPRRWACQRGKCAFLGGRCAALRGMLGPEPPRGAGPEGQWVFELLQLPQPGMANTRPLRVCRLGGPGQARAAPSARGRTLLL